MSSEKFIEVSSVSKRYLLYSQPQDRLKQLVVPKVKRFLRMISAGMLNLRDVQRYNEFWALKNVSVTLNRGETLGIIGKNGSGKSTLLQIVCGTLTPTSGTRSTRGRIAALLELGAGFNPDFTGRENVFLNASIYGLSIAEIKDRMQAIIDFAEIGEHIDQPVKTYSSGMFVRLAFSVIANVDAEILIIDEALAVGDAYFQQKCMRFLRDFQQKGSIFFVSHDTGAMMSFCDRVVWLDRGAIRAEGNPKQVCEEYLAFLYQMHTGASLEGEPNTAQSLAVSEETTPVSSDIVAFKPSSRDFGDRAAEIISVDLRHADGRELAFVGGGETVELAITFRANMPVRSVISGFVVKDRLGQYLFGDNTFATTEANPVSLTSGESATARFTFTMPLLAPGTYSVAPSVASGTLQQHVQHHWMHEGIIFTVHTSIATGVLMGIPMSKILLEPTSTG
jgi:lipopolysaccharide transport system ATP-binding protein